MSCHSNQSEYALAFLPEQLNRPGPDGRNQLVALTEAGFIRRAGDDGKPLPPFDADSAARERKLADPADDGQPLEARARATCTPIAATAIPTTAAARSPCGCSSPSPVAEMKAIDVRPTRGDFGLPDARIIKPGDPVASTLYFRMAKFGRDRMPHIGAERPDEAGLQLIARWIAGLERRRRTAEAGPRTADRRTRSLANPRSALPLARKLGRGELGAAERERLLAAAAKLPPGPIRDLFEGYLPSRRAEGRKLGSNPRPRAILALDGDAGRGREAVLVAADPVRQLPQDRRPGHAGRPGPDDHRQAPLARGPAGEHPGAVAPDRAEVRRVRRRDDRRPLADRPAGQARRETGGAARRPEQGDRPRGRGRGGTPAVAGLADARRTAGRPDRPGSGRPDRVSLLPQVTARGSPWVTITITVRRPTPGSRNAWKGAWISTLPPGPAIRSS